MGIDKNGAEDSLRDGVAPCAARDSRAAPIALAGAQARVRRGRARRRRGWPELEQGRLPQLAAMRLNAIQDSVEKHARSPSQFTDVKIRFQTFTANH